MGFRRRKKHAAAMAAAAKKNGFFDPERSSATAEDRARALHVRAMAHNASWRTTLRFFALIFCLFSGYNALNHVNDDVKVVPFEILSIFVYLCVRGALNGGKWSWAVYAAAIQVIFAGLIDIRDSTIKNRYFPLSCVFLIMSVGANSVMRSAEDKASASVNKLAYPDS